MPVLRLLVNILSETAKGFAVCVTSIHAKLTTQEAADLLNVSRAFLVLLLGRGDIPYHKVSTHRCVRYNDAIAY